MKIAIEGNTLTKMFILFNKSSETEWSFTIKDDLLIVEMIDTFVVKSSFKYLNIEGAQDISINVKLNKVASLFVGTEPIVLDISKDYLTISQSTVACTYYAIYGSPVNYPEVKELKELPVDKFNLIAKICRVGASVQKELSLMTQSVTFYNNKAYIDYSQIAYVVDIDFDDCVIDASILRSIASVIKDDSKYYLAREVNKLYIETGNYKIVIPTTVNNMPIGLNTILNDIKQYGEVSIKDYLKQLSGIAKSFPKRKVDLIFQKDKFSALINDSQYYINLGSITEDDSDSIRIQTTTATLNTIVEMFDSFKVYTGRNCLCLQDATKSLIVAGLLY